MNIFYWNRYLKFISFCEEQTPEESDYCENHHILPKSFGGDNTKDNIIRLTFRQHFIAHYLLWKAVPCKQTGNGVHAFQMRQRLSKGRFLTSNQIKLAREIKSKCQTGVKLPQEHYEKIKSFWNSEEGKNIINSRQFTIGELNKNSQELYWVNIETGEEVIGTRADMKNWGINRSHISAIIKGTRTHSKGWMAWDFIQPLG